MSAYFNAVTSLLSADFKTGSILREWIRTVFIVERYGDQKLCFFSCSIVHVADLFQIELVPVVRSVFTHISFVLILDSISKGVCGLSQLPGKYFCSVRRISHHGRIASWCFRRPVQTHQAVFASNLPVVIVSIVMVKNVGEQTFGPGAIVRDSRKFL